MGVKTCIHRGRHIEFPRLDVDQGDLTPAPTVVILGSDFSTTARGARRNISQPLFKGPSGLLNSSPVEEDMAHPLTIANIKKPILDLIRREFGSVLEPPAQGPEEYRLQALASTFRCDFAYRIRSGGWCFIEDDSEGTCLSNLLKYDAWIEETHPPMPVVLMHLVSPVDSAWIRLCRREGGRLQATMPGFRHILITTPDWPEHAPKWLDQLRIKLQETTVNNTLEAT